LQATWNDINNPTIFTPNTDIAVLITGPLSKTDIHDFRPLLLWARTSSSASEFLEKVETPNFCSDGKRAKLGVVKEHLDNVKGSAITNEELWIFLRNWHLFNYDLDTDDSINSTLIKSMVGLCLNQGCQKAPQEIWALLIEHVQNVNLSGGSITPGNIPNEIRTCFTESTVTRNDSLNRLKEHSDLIHDSIQDTLGNGEYKINRSNLYLGLNNFIEENRFVFVTGPAGSGKTVVVKNAIDQLEDFPVFYFRVEEFNQPHLDQTLENIRVKETLSNISARFALLPQKLIVIESVEKLLEFDNTDAFQDIINFIKVDKSWTLLVSGRDYAASSLINNFFINFRAIPNIFSVPIISDDNLAEVLNKFPVIIALTSNASLSSLLKIPFYLDHALKILPKLTDTADMDVPKFMKEFWNWTIGKPDVQKDGLHRRRISTFKSIAVNRAKAMTIGIPPDRIADQAALHDLIVDQLIIEYNEGQVAPAHDVLEDIALEKYIEDNYERRGADLPNFFSAIGSEYAIRRVFRFWFQHKFEREWDILTSKAFLKNILGSKEIENHWKDEVIVSILTSGKSAEFLFGLQDLLLESNCELLDRFCFILRTSCKQPNISLLKTFPIDQNYQYLLASSFLHPVGVGWDTMIEFIESVKERLHVNLINNITDVISEWSLNIKN
ncbi:MAG: hypothetical protein HQ517_01380, partial [SAR324 cluster bacterium]|nr:hypothetical protein [SAR324 cluster bacterium]